MITSNKLNPSKRKVHILHMKKIYSMPKNDFLKWFEKQLIQECSQNDSEDFAYILNDKYLITTKPFYRNWDFIFNGLSVFEAKYLFENLKIEQ